MKTKSSISLNSAKAAFSNLSLIEESPQTPSTYLSDKQMKMLQSMFCNEEKYRYYMKTLWILRDLAEKACTDKGSINVENPNFPILKTINEFIGCLLPNKGGSFDATGNMIKH